MEGEHKTLGRWGGLNGHIGSFPQPVEEEGPYLLQDVTTLTFSASFAPGAVARRLPAGLHPCNEASGGVEFLVARRGHALAPLSCVTIWFDLAGPRGDLVAPRYAARRYLSRSLPGEGDSLSGQIRPGEEADTLTADLRSRGQSILSGELRTWGSAFAAAGVTIYHDAPLADAPRRPVPWSAILADAEPMSLTFLTPDLADLQPLEVYGATLGTNGAVTLGIRPPA
jgi:hypothetical protein